MIPSLARRGKLAVATGSSFIFVGALYSAPPLVALGGILLSSLLAAYLWFFPTAILLRRRKVEISWWVPPGEQPGGALSVDRPFDIHVALRNHGGRALRVLNVEMHGSSALELPTGLEGLVPPGRQVEVAGQATSHAAGYQVLHGAVLIFGDVLGLFDVRAFFPNPVALKVFPRQARIGRYGSVRPRGGALHENIGIHHVRRRGLAGELREIREYSYGDPFKFIAWKATARRRKLMIRELETEVVVTHQILVDISGSLRSGKPGHTKLDYAIDTAAALAAAALESGDRVGLVTFDSRVYSQLRPAAGHHHYLKLVDRLVETHSIVDEDLTDLTNGELAAAVARYLAHQEAVDVRIRRAPGLDDPAWNHIQAGPNGELYDLSVMGTVVASLLKQMGQAAQHKATAPAWWWSRVHVSTDSDPQMAKLRLFCRLRGIELPYRVEHEAGARARGLADSLHLISTGARADVVAIVTDLFGILDRPDLVTKSVARARRGGQRVVVIAPFGPSFAPTPRTRAAGRVADVLRRDEQDLVDEASRVLMRMGVPVVMAGPEDNPALLMRKLARSRSPRRRVA